MAKSTPLAQIEHAIGKLSYDERLWLIERLVHGLRQCSREALPPLNAALAEMTADPEMQRELAEIAQELTSTDPRR